MAPISSLGGSRSARWLRVTGTMRDKIFRIGLTSLGGQARTFQTFKQGPLREGFTPKQYGLDWFPSKAALLESSPGKVLVSTSYEYRRSGSTRPEQARKYASFLDHFDYWRLIHDRYQNGALQNIHEVLPSDAPRCLYFDIDGKPELRAMHSDIMTWLQSFVRWFFAGDRLGWTAEKPTPVVLTSGDPLKYSCHVIFPEVQFANHQHQCDYMPVLLNALPALKVELEDGEMVPILDMVVDRVPYSQFQLFRGPWACKMKDGLYREDSQLQPEEVFNEDPLSCFAGYVDPNIRLPLASITELLQWNDEVRSLNESHSNYVKQIQGPSNAKVSPQDASNLYKMAFQQNRRGELDFLGKFDIDVYEEGLKMMHPDRASQFWSWFRVSGVTYKMLERFGEDSSTRGRIWNAHHTWSSTYPGYDEAENVDQVLKNRGKCVSGLNLLKKLVRFDNPGMTIRDSMWHPPLTSARN
mmetsp:Transcript_33321/g.72755  ORF Transcript_33321/g.72755 Transcript_33321/m.72755 type:complete len:468 (-) Transcript_33321:471-1874(-)